MLWALEGLGSHEILAREKTGIYLTSSCPSSSSLVLIGNRRMHARRVLFRMVQ